MSEKPVDKRRAQRPKRPWYVRPATWKVVMLLLRLALKVLDRFG